MSHTKGKENFVLHSRYPFTVEGDIHFFTLCFQYNIKSKSVHYELLLMGNLGLEVGLISEHSEMGNITPTRTIFQFSLIATHPMLPVTPTLLTHDTYIP